MVRSRHAPALALVGALLHAGAVHAGEPAPGPLPLARGLVSIEADELTVDPLSGVVAAEGGVSVHLPSVDIAAQSLLLRHEDGVLEAGDVRLTLDLAHGLATARARRALAGPARMVLTEGVLTLCGCEPPPWALRFSSLSVSPNGDIVVKDGWIELGGRSVAPLPYLLLRTGREPGLLPPELGWLAERGAHVSLGARLPLSNALDLGVRAGWIVASGMSLTARLEGPLEGAQASFILDPVDEGLDAAWMAGRLWGSGALPPHGLVLDLPLSDEVARRDMPAVRGGAGRVALSSLTVQLEPSLGGVDLFTQVALARSLVAAPRDGAARLRVRESWIRAPGLILAAGPWMLGRSTGVVLESQLAHVDLVSGGATDEGPVHLHVTDAELLLSGRFLPGRIVEIETLAAWHGSVVHGHGDEALTTWSQLAVASVAADMAIESPALGRGWHHRLGFGLDYRASLWARTSPAAGVRFRWPAEPPARQVAAVTVDNELRLGSTVVLALTTAAWILDDRSRGALGMVSAEGCVDLGAARLGLELSLPTDRPAPSLASTSLRLDGSAGSLTARHLWLDATGPTTLDAEAWTAGRWLLPAVRGEPASSLNLVMMELRGRLGRDVTLSVDGGMDVAGGRLAWVRSGVHYSHPCGCLEVGVSAMVRAGLAAPDLLVTLSL